MRVALPALLLVAACTRAEVSRSEAVAAVPTAAVETPENVTHEVAISREPPAPLHCIAAHYDVTERRSESGWELVLPSGRTIPYAAVEEVYETRYSTGPIQPVTEVDFDPGRVRIDELFFATYGSSAKDVERALTRVKIGGKTVLVHRKIEGPLRRVAERIDRAMKADPSLTRFFESLGGTFNWRKIAGTDELSMHAWGIAIDLDVSRSNYWRNEGQKPITWKNQYPQAIVDAFEAEGFVWGGRWYHYDTMHFEYRPELLDARCYPAAT